MIDEIFAEVERRAIEEASDIAIRAMQRFSLNDSLLATTPNIGGTVKYQGYCDKHSRLIILRTAAAIRLHRARRAIRRGDLSHTAFRIEARAAREDRETHNAYHAAPCTCHPTLVIPELRGTIT